MQRFLGCLKYAAIVMCLMTLLVRGQGRESTPIRQRFDAVPTILNPMVEAVGPRLHVKGKERTVFVGEYTDEAGKHFPVRVVHQLPNLVILSGFGKDAPALKFDGKKATLRKAVTDDALLETLATDTCEGMLAAIQKGAAVRLLGRFVKPEPKEDPNYKGAGFDAYEVTAPVSAIAGESIRTKLYLFDSSSGLLASTRYKDDSSGRGKDVEIRFSNWQKIDESEYAGQIDRYEDGRPIFSIAITSVSNSARVDPQAFNEFSTEK